MAAVFAACGVSARESARPDVVLLVVDAARSELLTCSSRAPDAWPILAQLAQRGVVIGDLTSGGLAVESSLDLVLRGRPSSALADPGTEPRNLAEVLSADGYRTLALVSDPGAVASRGFERFVTVAEQEAGEPALPRDSCAALVEALPEVLGEFTASDRRPPVFLLLQVSPSERALEGVAVEARLGRLLQGLEQADLADGTLHALVCASSARGAPPESLAHGVARSAGPSQARRAAAAPLFLWGGSLPAGVRILRAARDVDLFPTLLEAAQVAPPPDLEGRSLLRLIEGEGEGWSRYVFRDGPADVSVRDIETEFELLVPTAEGAASGRGFELYDCCADPEQRTNLAAARTDQVLHLLRAYESWIAAAEVPGAAARAPDTRRMLADQLEGLGYTSLDAKDGGE